MSKLYLFRLCLRFFYSIKILNYFIFYSLLIKNHKDVEAIKSRYEQNLFQLSGVTDQLNANLHINSNRMLQKISEEIKDKNNQSENGKNKKNKQINYSKHS